MRLIAILAAGAICIPVSAIAQGWTQYPFPDQGFAIQLPNPPTITSTTVSAPPEISGPAKIYSLKSGAATYTLSIIDLSNSSISQQDAIRAAEQMFSGQGTVRAALNERVNQQFGRELSVDKADDGKLIVAIFYVNHHLFELSGTANGSNAQAESSNLVRFQQSLEFIGQNGGPNGRGGRGGPGGRGINPEAVAACSGKSAGDKVQFETPGGTAAATCILIARPDQPPGQGGGGFGGNRRPLPPP